MITFDQKLEAEYEKLGDDANRYAQGEISATDFKHTSAPLGIYEQSNGKIMIRVRIPGGELTVAKLKSLQQIASDNAVGYAHITTRGDIQLQDVPLEKVVDVVRACKDAGMPFRGGGGNTFRNIVCCDHTGVDENSIFDVRPWLLAVNDVLMQLDKAFEFPRKYKIGFSCCNENLGMALVQDLGFVAKKVDGQDGFAVYGAGGLGRNSRTGMLLQEFIPASECVRAALAMADLFYDHGDRENRNRARIRFIAERLGDDEFRTLYLDYYAEVDDCAVAPVEPVGLTADCLNILEDSIPTDPGYLEWQGRAVSTTSLAGNILSVRLFIPYGNFAIQDFGKLIEILEQTGCPVARFSTRQNILLPIVDRTALPRLYDFAQLETWAGESLEGLLTCCIGANVCKIGILDSQQTAKQIAAELDDIVASQSDAESRSALFRKVLDGVRISGCPNSCSGHPTASLGFQGMKKKINGELADCYRVFTGACLESDDAKLAENEDDLVVESRHIAKHAADHLTK